MAFPLPFSHQTESLTQKINSRNLITSTAEKMLSKNKQQNCM
jgi:hypothetical protein